MSEIDRLKEQVEQRLQSQQSSKEFKDVGRVAQTKKEKSAFRILNSQMLKDLEQDAVMAYNMVKKDAVWPKIDVEEERKRGVTSGAVYLKTKVREAVPTRPKDSPQARTSYVIFLERVQNDLLECYNVKQIDDLFYSYRKLDTDKAIEYLVEPRYGTASEDEKREIKAKLGANTALRVAMMYGGFSLVSKLMKEIFSAKFENLLFKYSDAAKLNWIEARDKEPVSEDQSKEIAESLKQKKERFVTANLERIESYKKMSDSEIIDDMSKNWNIHSDLKKEYKANPNVFREWVIGFFERKIKIESERYDKLISESKPRDNDWSWIEQTKEKSETSTPKSKSINTKSPLSYIKRTGGYAVENITPNEIVNKFGFNAVNYGVYVDDAWSRDHTKHFLGAMSDLAEMLDINLKQINELGKLSIAFGAKGIKGHLATYFPQTKDINLTRGNGDGSIAHEWGHYFDNVIVEFDAKRATNSFASQKTSNDPEINDLFKELMDFIYKGNDLYTPKIPFTFYAKKSDNPPTYSKKENGEWKSVTVEAQGTIDETIAKYSDIAFVSQDLYMTQLRVFGYILDLFGVESYPIPFKLKTSYFYHKSAYNQFQYCYEKDGRYLIGVSSRTKYWASDVELFARAFETVILKKILDKGRVSNYLVDDIPLEDIISESYHAPYPTGMELSYIESLIDKIVSKVKSKYSISSYVPISSTREDQYLELTKKEGKTKNGLVVEKGESEDKLEFIKDDNVDKNINVSKEEKTADSSDSQQIKEAIDGLEILLSISEDETEKEQIQDALNGLKILLEM